MKYEKFEGSLGEFLEQYVTGTTQFYTLDAGHYSEVFNGSVGLLFACYEGGVYTEKEEVWTDHLPVLCWVSDYEGYEEEDLAIVTEYDDGQYFVEEHGCTYGYARPVTQEEIDKLIWKK